MADASYERSTQLVPAGIVLAPLSILVLVVFRANDVSSLMQSVIGVILTAGFHVVAMRLIRDRGNAVQGPLWESWGGSTTIQRLRWRSQPPASVRRLHRRVEAMTGVSLPSKAAEAADPVSADGAYEDAVSRLRELTRDHDRYPRVWSELKQYGAARNLYGAKPAAVWIAWITVIAAAVMVFASLNDWWGVAWYLPAFAGAAAIVIASGWLAIVSPNYVRTASDRYSDALLSVADEPGITRP